MGHRVDAAGAMKEEDRADESPPDQHLETRCMERWIAGLKECSQAIDQDGQKQGANQVKTVQENKFRKLRKIRNASIIGGEIPAAGHPPDVCPEKSLLARGMHIDLLIGVGVVMPVDGRPPESSTLYAEQADQRKKKLNRSTCFVSLVAEVPVIDSGDKKHPHHIEKRTDDQGRRAPANPDDSEASEMQENEGNGPPPIHPLRQCLGGCDPGWKIVRVDAMHQPSIDLAGEFSEVHLILDMNLIKGDLKFPEQAVEIIGAIILDGDMPLLLGMMQGDTGREALLESVFYMLECWR